MSNHRTFVDLDHARDEDQRRIMEDIINKGICPFCPEHLANYLRSDELIWRGEYWVAAPNRWPRHNTKVHLVVVYRPHAERLGDIDIAAGVELFVMLKHIESLFSIPGGALLLRFGESSFSGASVRHLHAQIIVPDKEEGNDPVRIKIG